MRYFNLLAALLLPILLLAQAPQAFDFQGVARDAGGNVMSSEAISLRISILAGSPGGDLAYQETHSVITSPFGLFTIQVGNGTPTQSTFPSIGWGASAHFIQVELDASGGSNFQDMGTTQLLSVPYALHARATDCFTVSLLGDTLHQGNGCHVIIPGISVANGGCLDLDGDGVYDNPGCSDPIDCDDNDATVYPGAPELCGDGKDNDCDGFVDNNTDVGLHSTWFQDADGDDFGNADLSQVSCTQPAGFVANNEDCDDTDATRFPGQGCSLVCTTAERDWIDQNMSSYLDRIFLIWANCFGSDPSCVEQQLVDLELSGTVPLSLTCHSCAFTYVECIQSNCALACLSGPFSTACTECIATNCRQEFIACAGLIDADGDGWSAGSDCNDSDATIYPGATEVCDGVDNDCDGNIDDADTQVAGNFIFYRDADGDGAGDENVTIARCSNVAPAGYVEQTGFLFDCNDQEPSVYPGAPEVCDPWDNDCDGLINEEDALGQTLWSIDEDGDGFGNVGVSLMACDPPTGYVANGEDCDDSRDDIFPGALEDCFDGIDNDCDGLVDEVDQVWYEDLDGDGSGNEAVFEVTCTPEPGYVLVPGDCDDTNPDIRPNTTETCGNGLDDNCDGFVDEDCIPDLCDGLDNDGDGQVDEDFVPSLCCGGVFICVDGEVICTGGQPSEEVCDGIDNDCDGLIDEGGVCGDPEICNNGVDDDGDGLIDCADPDCAGSPTCQGIDADGDGFTEDVDCNDDDPSVSPGAVEVCNGIDDNCDGQTDEGYNLGQACGCGGVVVCDGSGSSTCSVSTVEICNGIDDNCDGQIDEDLGLGQACGCGGVRICDGNGGVVCSVPEAEICGNGIDDDCNGQIDDGCVGTECGFFNGTQQGSCGFGDQCVNGFCVPCTDNDLDGFTDCDGDCNDSDPAIFPGASELCNGIDDDCNGQVDEGFNLASDPQNCGACGIACPSLPNATVGCFAGACAIQSCNPGFADCDGIASNGCETNLMNSNSNCGSCSANCTPRPNATVGCVNGNCVIVSCSSGFADCDGVLSNGCEVNLSTSMSNCGGCGNACTLPNANTACNSGLCALISCQTGFADCDGIVGNGCETFVGGGSCP